MAASRTGLMSGYVDWASGNATAVATACTTRFDSRVIDFSPAARRALTCSAVSSSMVRWLNQVAAPTATATTTEVVRINFAEIGIPARPWAGGALTYPEFTRFAYRSTAPVRLQPQIIVRDLRQV